MTHLLFCTFGLRKTLTMFILMVVGSSCQHHQGPDETEIREVRELSNQAIAKHDTAALARAWTDDYHVVTSRNAAVSGRMANMISYGSNFSERPDVIYTRTPDRIQVFSQWNMASESGTWIGRWTEPGKTPENRDEKVELSGSYFAKWHRVNGKWLIRAEIFVPLACSGRTYCNRIPI